MHRSFSRRVLAIALLLSRLVLGDVLHLPAAEAAVPEKAPVHMMMGGEPCTGMAGMAGMPADPRPHPSPGNDGSCCKSSQCLCLHAPALAVTVLMPVAVAFSASDMASPQDHAFGEPAAVFFRPPI